MTYLLESNADANARDRFDGTALHDSIRHRAPEAVNSALKKAGCQLLGMDTAIALCEASALGDLPAIRTLVENGVEPNLGDYDGLSPSLPPCLSLPPSHPPTLLPVATKESSN